MKPTAIMAAMVISENRTLSIVFRYTWKICGMLKPMTSPEMMPARKMLVPVALSQLRPNLASSGGVSVGTTGGVRCTMLSRPGTGNCGLVILLGGGLHFAIDRNIFCGVFMIVLPVF